MMAEDSPTADEDLKEAMVEGVDCTRDSIDENSDFPKDLVVDSTEEILDESDSTVTDETGEDCAVTCEETFSDDSAAEDEIAKEALADGVDSMADSCED